MNKIINVGEEIIKKPVDSTYKIINSILKHHIFYTVDVSTLLKRMELSTWSRFFKHIPKATTQSVTLRGASQVKNIDDIFTGFGIFSNETFYDITVFKNTPIILCIKQGDKYKTEQLLEVSLMTFRNKKSISNLHKLLAMLVKVQREYVGKEILSFYYTTVGGLHVKRNSRTFKDVFVDDKQLKLLRDTIKSFKENKKFFMEHHIPYHTGILFYGKPGTGKTSIIQAMCNEYKLVPIYVDTTLENWLNYTKDNVEYIKGCGGTPAVIIEDIDTIKCFISRKNNKKDNEKINDNTEYSLSAILNTLDGCEGMSNVVYLFTTNDKNVIDAAVLRPGRIDLQLEIGYVTDNQFNKYLKAMFNKSLPKDRHVKDNVIIAYVNYFIRCGHDYKEVIKEFTYE